MKWTVALLSLFLFTGSTQAKVCTQEDAAAADLAVDGLNSWEAIQQNSVDYCQCDDGSIAEGNSEAVARMLVDKWPEIGKLETLISRYPSLQEYILKHVDSTLATDDLNRIIELSTKSCPEKNKMLCKELISAAKKSLE